MSVSLQGRVAIVTGASRGVGRACALALAREGCHVVLAAKTTRPHDRLPGTIHSVADEIRAASPEVEPLAVACDVRKDDDLEALIHETASRFSRIDILVNNAGAAWWLPVEETPGKRFDLVMDVNFRAPLLLSRAVLPFMREGEFGHIVNMAPPVDRKEMVVGKCAYMVSKFGMTYLTVALAEEWKDEPIAVHSLWPVTLIESAATRNLGLGEPSDWRKADILADATVALCTREPGEGSGRAWLDEEVLRELRGMTDLASYAVVPGTEPKGIPW